MGKKYLVVLITGIISSTGLAQDRFAKGSIPFIHSHNDYYREAPLLDAIRAGAKSIEVDVFLHEGDLYVAHTKAEISKGNLFEDLYILPLIDYLQKPKEMPSFHFMVDIKSKAAPTLYAIQECIAKYPDVFNSSQQGIQLVISGNRPKVQDYPNYKGYIWFDGRSPRDANERVALVSRNFKDFSGWDGNGFIPGQDSIKLAAFVAQCHANNLPVRFWNTPDTYKMYKLLYSIGVGYINTDEPQKVQGYLRNHLKRQQFPAWEEGYLDIHHINTGRGDASFMVFPDGTTMLVDMGDMSEKHPRTLSPRNTPALPNNSKTPAQWVADYIFQFHPEKRGATIDIALITHYHDDHFGEVDPSRKEHKKGGYKLTGITELGSIIPIRKLVDRGYAYPINLKDKEIQQEFGLINDPYSMIQTLEEYWKFIEYQKVENQLEYEEFKVGSTNQLGLLKAKNRYQDFKVHNLFANGKVASGWGHGVSESFKKGTYPGENNLSIGIRVSYGVFDYYTGADISGIDKYGQVAVNSMESKVASVIGPVDVATLNHHGNRDSQNPYYISTIRPRVWVQQSWSSDHPGEDVLRRLISRELYPGERDLFSTSILEPNKLVIGDRVGRSYKTTSGHIVIRVYPGGNLYEVFVLNDKDKNRGIVKMYSYQSR